MLGKVDWWDRAGGVGTVTDVEGKEWHITDDMMDDDAMHAKMKDGFILNFEPNPSMDNSGMRLTMASPDDKARFDKERAAKKSPLADGVNESAKSEWDKAEEVRDEIQLKLKQERGKEEPDRAKIKDLVKKLSDARKKAAAAYKKYKAEDITMMQSALLEAEGDSLDIGKIKNEAPHDLQEYVALVLDEADRPLSIEFAKEACEDGDKLSEAADSYVDVYTKDLLAWYAEDISRIKYADEAHKEHKTNADVEKLLQLGQYYFHSDYIQKAADWLKKYLEDQESETTEEGAEIGGLVSR
jgi:hypothetical protein